MKYVITIVLYSVSLQLVAQKLFYANNAPTLWTNPSHWDVGAPGNGPDGTTPGATDDVYTNGFVVVASGPSLTCRNLFIDDATVNSLVLGSQLTVTGTMIAWSTNYFGFGFPFQSYPSVATIGGAAPLVFTGANVNTNGVNFANEVISNWNSTAPIPSATFNFGVGVSRNIANIGSEAFAFAGLTPGDLRLTNSFTLSTGNLDFDQSTMLRMQIGNSLTVTSGTLRVNLPFTQTSSNTSLISVITNSGQIDLLDSDSYLNGNTVNLNSGSDLNISFSGADQTEAWWYQSSSPTTIIADASSNVTYLANSDQNVGAENYGNLIIAGTGTKNLVSGILDVAGDLTITSTFNTAGNTNDIDVAGNVDNDGVWSPTQLVIFSGTSAQQITGNGTMVFEAGLRIENTSASVSLFNQDIDVNDLFDIDPSASFDPDDNNVSLSGNLQNDGTLISGTVNSTFTFDGSTSINGIGNHSFNDIIISNTLTSSSTTINVTGDFTNNGTFNRNGGTVNFNGTTSISGTVAFENMDINGTVGNTGTLQLFGTFTPTTGSFNTGNNFTVMSVNVTGGDGRIAEVPAAGFTFSGNLTVQRYVDGVVDGDWRYFTSPVIGANLNNWLSSGMPITGDFTDASPAGVDNVVSQTAPSVYTRNSAAGTWDPVTSGGALTSTVALGNGTGYSVYTYVDNDLTLSVNGTLPGGTVNTTLTGAGGVDPFYLVGNPYPSPIDWDDVHSLNNTLGSTVYVRVGFDDYASYNTGVGAGTNHPDPTWGGEILMGQSFWVDNTAAASNIQFTQSMKSPVGTGQFLRESENSTELIRIRLFNEDQSDETVVYFKEGSTDLLEPNVDGIKQLNGTFSVSLGRNSYINLSSYNPVLSDTIQYVFNAISGDFCEKEVMLNVRDLPEGSYELEFNKYTIGAYSVKLIDSYTSAEVPITLGSSYPFDVDANALSQGDDRFKLFFNAIEIDENLVLNSETLNGCDADYIEIIIDNAQNGIVYELFNETGQQVSNPVVANDGLARLFVNKVNLAESLNFLSVTGSATSSCSGSFTYENAITFEYNSVPGPPVTTDISVCSDQPGSIVLSASGAPGNGFYRWYDSVDSPEPLPGENQNELVLDNLSETKWYYVSSVNADGCESDRVKLEAELINVGAPEVTIIGQTLIAPEADSYIWYLNNEVIEDASSQSIEASESGEYVLEISINGCSAISESIILVITDIDDEFFQLGLNVYPNPVTDRLNFSAVKAALDLEEIEFNLFDLDGRLVKNNDNLSSSFDKSLYLELGDLTKGLYILNITTADKVLSLQIAKH